MTAMLADSIDEPFELLLQVRFEGGEALPSSFITESIEIIQREIFKLELDELDEISKDLEIPALTRDACYHRLERGRGSSLLLTRASDGSIIIGGVLAALSYWVVQNTLGETVKDAYKLSGLHERLKALLLRRFSFRRTELVRRLNERFVRPVADPVVLASIRADSQTPTLIELDLRLNRWEHVAPRSSLWMNRPIP